MQQTGRVRTLMAHAIALFCTKKFLRYTGIGILISLFNVFLLWLFIDVFGIGTVTAGFVVTVIIFITRYVLLAVFKIV